MTYQTVLERLRFRMRDVKNLPLLYHEDGALFTIINEAARELWRKTRDYEKSADLTIVSGQQDYDIASEIGVDVGEIYDIILNTGENSLMGRSLKPFNEQVQRQTALLNNTNSEVTATPSYFRVWEDTLRIYPIPSTADTGTVYYFAKEPLISYSNANLTLQIRLNEEYLESLLTYSKGLVYEIAGDEQRADKKKLDALAMVESVKENRISYDHSAVTYHEVL